MLSISDFSLDNYLTIRFILTVYNSNLTRVVPMHRCIDASMHRDTWADDTRIVSRPKYRDTYRDTYHVIVTSVSRYVTRITMPQEAHHVMSTLHDNACIAIRVSIPPPAARRSI